MSETSCCSICGRPIEAHQEAVRFRLPQLVLDAHLDTEGVPERTWGSDVMMQVDGIGAFVRVLVDINLTGGFRVQFGAWLDIHPNELQRVWAVWEKPEYMELELHGVLANMLPPWEKETYGKQLVAVPRVASELPYAISSSDPELQEILTREWDHDVVLDALSPFVTASAEDIAKDSGEYSLPWPFADNRFPGNLLAYTMRTVAARELPALHVVHFPDNEWAVADGVNDPNDESMLAPMHMRHLIDHDPTLEELATLPIGQEAYREAVGEPWQIEQFEWAEDEE